jgi:opine dehydrogenase
MNITILGAGNTGLAMAAHSAEQGHRVTLWNRSEATITQLIKTHTIYSNGKIDGEFDLHLVTTDIREALVNPDLILISTPSFAHKYLAEMIGKNISKETLILLCPGRTFGALEFKAVYEEYNQQFAQTIAETQTSIYTCRKTAEDTVDIISIKYDVLFSAINSQENNHIFEGLPTFLQRQLEPAKSMIETSIGSVGMILHCAPSLLNIGWTENKKYEFKHYTEGITETIASLLEKIDQERIEVSKKLGTEVESVKEWLKRVYKVEGETLYESIQNTEAYETIGAPNILDNRYITEDVPNGLVPLESAGLHLGLDMKYTSLIIDLACALLDTDFRERGRNLDTVFQGDAKEIELFINGSEVV